MRIGALATQTGLTVKTIRYYESIGLLDAPRRSPSGYRDYDTDAAERLRFIRASQASGLSLGEIRGIVAFRDRGESPCAHVLDVLRRRAAAIDQQIQDLVRARDVIESLVARADGLDPNDCAPSAICHIINARTDFDTEALRS